MSTPEPVTENGGRWDHVASDDEARAALGDHGAEIVEASITGHTFVLSGKTLTIVRAGAFGGDVRTVECAWKYANPFSYMRDAMEIRAVGRIVRRTV